MEVPNESPIRPFLLQSRPDAIFDQGHGIEGLSSNGGLAGPSKGSGYSSSQESRKGAQDPTRGLRSEKTAEPLVGLVIQAILVAVGEKNAPVTSRKNDPVRHFSPNPIPIHRFEKDIPVSPQKNDPHPLLLHRFQGPREGLKNRPLPLPPSCPGVEQIAGNDKGPRALDAFLQFQGESFGFGWKLLLKMEIRPNMDSPSILQIDGDQFESPVNPMSLHFFQRTFREMPRISAAACLRPPVCVNAA